MTTASLAEISSTLYHDAKTGAAALCQYHLQITYASMNLAVQSNSEVLIKELKHYFRQFLNPAAQQATTIVITAIETAPVQLPLEFHRWPRDAGKQGSAKDSFFDFPQQCARIIRKVRTGMVYLQSAKELVVSGACLKNISQVINFINHQILNRHLNHGALLCHAAALTINGKGIGIAGFSGGGKSTTMLHLLDFPGSQFISNDRAFVFQKPQGLTIAGIPKMPRINPGTIVHNPKLQGMIDAERRAELLAMPKESLWELEEKYDADVEAIWGEGSICSEAPLESFFILNWQRDSSEPLAVRCVRAEQRSDLLAAVKKSHGCFYQYSDGHFDTAPAMASDHAYIDCFQQLDLYEVSGAVDFAALQQWFAENFQPASTSSARPGQIDKP